MCLDDPRAKKLLCWGPIPSVVSHSYRAETSFVRRCLMDEIRGYAPRGSEPRRMIHLRVPDSTIVQWKRLADEEKLTLSAWVRALLSDGVLHRDNECGGTGVKAKLVERTNELMDARARIVELEAHRCPEVEALTGYDGPPREHGDALAEDPLERFYDVDAPQEDEVDQARLIVNAPRGRGVPPVVEENGWAG